MAARRPHPTHAAVDGHREPDLCDGDRVETGAEAGPNEV